MAVVPALLATTVGSGPHQHSAAIYLPVDQYPIHLGRLRLHSQRSYAGVQRIDRMAVVLRSANLVDSKNIKSQDDLIELLDGLMPEIDRMLEEGLPDVGVSGYKK